MSNTVNGVELAAIERPVYTALETYAAITDGRLAFDTDAAPVLELTPDRPNAARSATTVYWLGKEAGTLYVIAFAPGDGTGDENTYKLANISTGVYPQDAKVVPRSKKGSYGEAHLTIASFCPESRADAVLFAGNQALLGFRREQTVTQLAELGQSTARFQRVMADQEFATPTVTLTTGYRGALRDADPTLDPRFRFGDPHAVYNPHADVVQVCGFISSDYPHFDMLRMLGAVEPQMRPKPTIT